VTYTGPGIALSPENPRLIVVHGGFSDWLLVLTTVLHFVSTDGGETWNLRQPINPPPHGIDGPNDAKIYYGAISFRQLPWWQKIFGSS
jgi:hypothetical protein